MFRTRIAELSLSTALVLVFAGCSKPPTEKAAPAASLQANFGERIKIRMIRSDAGFGKLRFHDCAPLRQSY